MVGCAQPETDLNTSTQPENAIEEVEEDEVLQAKQEPPRLSLYKDSVYSTLYHADLKTSLSATASSLQWEVQGGRYHIYEEELSFFKKLRPLQRTILFLEKTKYDVFVTLTRGGQTQETNHIELDFSGLSPSSVKTELELDKLSPLPGEAVQLKVNNRSLEGFDHGVWEVKRLKKVSCPSLEDVLADVIQSELMTISELCDRFYEEPLEEGKDYLLEKGQASNEVHVTFKTLGSYTISFWGYDRQGQLLSKSFRRIILEGTTVSRR
ncbi:MAG: hypothetical protein HYY61_02885 [Deltaproteobacteria bacterium]|nr:hypothetical protein [Deltaproteobacteria bacterium]